MFKLVDKVKYNFTLYKEDIINVYRDLKRLEIKGWGRIYQVYKNNEKLEGYMLISDKVELNKVIYVFIFWFSDFIFRNLF